ncbi:MAG: DUF2807 domain-containing protein [Bacteroidota bacterium]
MKLSILSILSVIFFPVLGQEVEERKLEPYEKLIVHPYIDVELDESDESKIFISTKNWPIEDVIVQQKGKKLEVFLRGANTDKIVQSSNSWKKFRNVRVKVFLTYKDLNQVSMRGDGSFHCRGPIQGEAFSISLVGDSEAQFSSWKVDQLKASIIGDGKIHMGTGEARRQIWKVLGDGKIEASNLKARECRIRSLGDSDIRVYATRGLTYKIIGESSISYKGSPNIKGAFSIGEKHIRRIEE